MTKVLSAFIYICAIVIYLAVIGFAGGIDSELIIPVADTVTGNNSVVSDQRANTVRLAYVQPDEPPDNYISRIPDESEKPSEAEIQAIARVLYSECRGVKSRAEQAAVIWCILNRVDSDSKDFPDTIIEVVTQKNQFAYNPKSPVLPELEELAIDVMTRWLREKSGETDVGRVLPKDFTFFEGDGEHNYFRNDYRKPYDIYDWSLPSPYED